MQKVIIYWLIAYSTSLGATETTKQPTEQTVHPSLQGMNLKAYERTVASLRQKKQSVDHRVLRLRSTESDGEILHGIEYEHKAALTEAIAKFKEEGGDFPQKLVNLLTQRTKLYMFGRDLQSEYVGDVMWSKSPESSEQREIPILAVEQLKSDIREIIFSNSHFKEFNPPIFKGKIQLSDNFTLEQQEAIIIMLEASCSSGFVEFDEKFDQCRPAESIIFLRKQRDQLSRRIYEIVDTLQKVLNDYGYEQSKKILGIRE